MAKNIEFDENGKMRVPLDAFFESAKQTVSPKNSKDIPALWQHDTASCANPPSPEAVEVSSSLTALLGAVLTGDLTLVQTALTDHPKELNTAYAPTGNTPLHVAALNGYTDIARLLLEQPNIDTTRTNNEGKTALDLAREKGFEEIVQLLENNPKR